MKKLAASLLLFSCGLVAQNSNAQDLYKDSQVPESRWEYLIEPYIMFPNMSGTAGLGSLPDVSVDAKPCDVFSNLQIGAMISAEASRDKWHIGTDIIYMNLEQDVTPGLLIIDGTLNAKQFAFSATGLYSVMPWLDLGIGGTLNSLKLESEVEISNNGDASLENRKKSASWFDPMIVARTQNRPGAKFIYQIRADMGGFGIGSNFAYQLQFYAGYRFSELFQITGGYRVIGVDYEKNNSSEGLLANNRFLYDVTTFGPVIKLGFNF